MAIEDFDQVTIAPAKLRPFSKFIMSIGELPTSYLDSLSYAEQVTWFCDYLQNHVIPALNNNAEALEEVQGLMTQLQEYVDNYFEVGFPAEVSNKLDEMAEDGTLQNLLNNYANVQKTYNTYTELLADSSTFINGLRLKTLGYYTVNDGGQAEYIVTDTIDTTKYQVELSNSLYLELILKENTIAAEQIGCYGNGNNDDTEKMQLLINFASNKLTIIANKNYKITDTLTIPDVSNINIFINKITTNIENKPLLYFNHTRRSNINIGTINNTNKINIPTIKGIYNHQTACLLHGCSYLNLKINNIINFICGFTLYSTNGSGYEGCYYNQISCYSANVFLLTHLYNLDGAINGNTFNNCNHYIEEWTNPLNLNTFTILNDGESSNNQAIYTNNHNIFNNLMVEKPTADNNDYYVANLENASNFHINVDRIEIKPSLDLTKLVIFNANSNYNFILFNSAWFTIPTDKIRTGNNNVISSYTNYSTAYLPDNVANEIGVILNDNFNKVTNDIADGHFVWYPRTGQYRINGIFTNTIDLDANTNYIFANSKVPKNGVISTGIVYQINGGNPTQFTPIGSIRQVKNNSAIYLRLTNNLISGNYMFIDFTID